MKKVFCAYQEKHTSLNDDRVKMICSVYNKECPYNKASKAMKKCQECYVVDREDEYYD